MKLRTLLLLFFLCSAASAQTPLVPGTPIERKLQSGQVDTFTIDLEQNKFIQVVVEQSGIDVVVKVFSPSGKSLGEFDTPNGAEGPEHVSFVAVAAGSYRVEVGPLDSREPVSGQYQIKINEVRDATEQELKTSQNVEVTKAKGIALLTDIEALIPQMKSPRTRIKAQMQAGELLWEIDQKRASKLFADAAVSFKEFLTTLNADDFYFSGGTIVQLRHEIIQSLSERDPEAALNFLHSTSQLIADAFDKQQHSTQENALELAIADQIMRNNPKRALQMARQSLKHGYSPNLIGTLAQLARQDPELGAELANEIATKLVNEKLLKQPQAGHVAVSLLRLVNSARGRSQSSSTQPSSPLLTQDRVRELIQKLLDEALSYSQTNRQSYDYTRDIAVNMLMALKTLGQLDTFIPGGSASVDKKLAELNESGNQRFGGGQYVTVLDGKSSQLSVEAIGKMPLEMQEHNYTQLAYNKAQKNDLAGARQIINERITSPSMRHNALSQLSQIEMHQALSQGKIEEVLRILAAIRNVRERAQLLSQVALQMGSGLKRATLLSLLEQARALLSPSVQAEDQDQMFALLELSRAFSRHDVKRSFEIVDPLVEQFNDLTAAARTLDGFGQKYYEGEELDLQNSSPIAVVAGQVSSVLGHLAAINFERAKATTERIGAPEVRLKIYLDIAQQAIKATK